MPTPRIILVHGRNANGLSWNHLERNTLITDIWGKPEPITLAGHSDLLYDSGPAPDPDKGGSWCTLFKEALYFRRPAKDATMEGYIDAVAREIPDTPPGTPPGTPPARDIILVGHSMGGAVISHVAADPRYEPRIRQLVYLSAMYPADGDTIEDLEGRIRDDAKAGAIPLDPCVDFGPFLPECAPALVKQPRGPLEKPFRSTKAYEVIDKVYIGCTQDHIIPPAAQEGMRRRHATPPPFVPLDASHLPQYQDQKELAELLVDVLKRDVR